jgi:hypothetical protein
MGEVVHAPPAKKPAAQVAAGKASPQAPVSAGVRTLAPRRRIDRRDEPDDRALEEVRATIPMEALPFVQRRCACAGSDESCAKCAVQRRALPMSTPGDPLEVDADRAASRVMRFLGGDVTARATSPLVQRAATAPTSGRADASTVLSRIGPGRPLDGSMRARMEPAFANSFAGVRIHDDAGAAAMSKQLDARAFTIGQHIAFARGAYRPGTAGGDELLAHELAHTIQQRGAAPMIARKNAGGCAELAEKVDEQRDENSRAGKAAHIQIQKFFAKQLSSEVFIPRATKDQRKVSCPDNKVPKGFTDLFKWNKKQTEIGEIKSVDGAKFAAPDVDHYNKRAKELVGRLTDGSPCPVETPRDAEDVRWDKDVYGGHIAKGNKIDFIPLQSVIPETPPTRLGPFSGNPKKFLSCERRAGGAVLYWCSKTKTDDDEKKKSVKEVAKPAEKTEEDKKPKQVPLQIVDGEPAFSEVAQRLNLYAPPDRIWIVAFDATYFDDRKHQFENEQLQNKLRVMQIDPRSVPMIQLTAPFVALAPFALAIEATVVIAGLVAAGILLWPLLAAGGTATAGGGALAGGGTLAGTTGITATTSTGITLTLIEGGGGAAASSATATGAVASIAKGTAAAAAVIAIMLGGNKNANAAEIERANQIAAPLFDKSLFALIDVTAKVPAVGATIPVNGKSFKVALRGTTKQTP